MLLQVWKHVGVSVSEQIIDDDKELFSTSKAQSGSVNASPVPIEHVLSLSFWTWQRETYINPKLLRYYILHTTEV